MILWRLLLLPTMARTMSKKMQNKINRKSEEYEYYAAEYFTKHRGYFTGDPYEFVHLAKINAMKVIDYEAQIKQMPHLIARIALQERKITELQQIIDSLRFVEVEKRKHMINRKLSVIVDTPCSEGGDDCDCSVCSNSKKIMALIPCGHKELCARCTIITVHTTGICPICSTVISDVLRVFD